MIQFTSSGNRIVFMSAVVCVKNPSVLVFGSRGFGSFGLAWAFLALALWPLVFSGFGTLAGAVFCNFSVTVLPLRISVFKRPIFLTSAKVVNMVVPATQDLKGRMHFISVHHQLS